jgi:transposase
MSLVQNLKTSSQPLDHLGLVAATIDNLGLVDEIDRLLPLEAKAKTTMGQRVAAMILNGLGFVDDRLYLFPKFLSNKPVSRLLGEGLQAADFNDDTLGRCLDKIHKFGTNNLFGQLAFKIGMKNKLLGKSMHTDTTSITLYGDYEEEELEVTEATKDTSASTVTSAISDTDKYLKEETLLNQLEDRPIPKRGHAKNKRFDLKQMVLTLATTGKAGFPIWMESHSGNSSDAKTLQETAQRIQAFCKNLENAPSFLYVGDAAMYNNCVKYGNNLQWLSRVPEQVKLAKEILKDNTLSWNTIDENYKCHATVKTHNNVDQRWLVVFSQYAYDKETATLMRNVEKEHNVMSKALWHLGNQEFSCEKDAAKALKKFSQQLKYHSSLAQVQPLAKHSKTGRPVKDSKPDLLFYKIEGKLTQDEEAIINTKMTKGKFILATNHLDTKLLSDYEMLSEYKEQSSTESGFKFIKDNSFEVSSIFVKKPERISALMMVMTLCLMVYSFAQYTLRNTLIANEETIPSQTNKMTNKPTMKWIYRLFYGVAVVKLQLEERAQEIVTNIDELLTRIIRYFGSKAMLIYDVV